MFYEAEGDRMGVDIKLFVEIDYADSGLPFLSEGDIRSLAFGELFVRRNYSLYYLLAGLPTGTVPECENEPVHLRGIPPMLSDVVFYRYYHIVDEAGYIDAAFDTISSSLWTLPVVPEETAQLWVDSGQSHYARERLHGLGRRRRRRVSGPNWHYANWLTADEFLSIVRLLETNALNNNPEIIALSALLNELKDQLGPERARAIYWFDNELPPASN